MRKIILFIIILFVISCEKNSPPSVEKKEAPSIPKVVVEKEKTPTNEPLPPEVKIKLRRDGKDNYSWELSGSDVDQILKVNEKLRRSLTKEQSN